MAENLSLAFVWFTFCRPNIFPAVTLFNLGKGVTLFNNMFQLIWLYYLRLILSFYFSLCRPNIFSAVTPFYPEKGVTLFSHVL